MRRENPVFWYHLIGQSRYRWHKQKGLTLIVSALIALLYIYLLTQTIKYETDPLPIQLLGLLIVCLLIPLGCYALFSMEYEKATWESLAITRLTGDEIVFGKWFSRVLGVLVVVLLMMPISLIAWYQSRRFHISFSDWLGSMWMMLGWGVLLVSMGMWLSLRLRHSIASASTLYGVQVFALLFLPLLIVVLMELATMGVGSNFLTDGVDPYPSMWELLRFWLTMPFDWRSIFWLNPFMVMETLFGYDSHEEVLSEYGFGWGQGCYYWLFSGLFYLLTRRGVRHYWRK